MDTNLINNYLNMGLSVIPIKDKKASVGWKEYQTRLPNPGELHYNGSIALICGHVSGNVEAIDVDVKNDSSGTLTERIQESFKACNVELDLCIQSTPSGGYHFVYKCETVEGNQVLAKSKDKKTIIETRGTGGYIAIDPTPGYKLLEGAWTNIPSITPGEREGMFTALRLLNEDFEEIKPRQYIQTTNGLTPWDDYNFKADIPELLEKHNWKYLRTRGENIHFVRPDKKENATSATWSTTKKLFYVFTSSTIFEPGKAYSAAAVYTYLECNKDFSEAGKKLLEEGYGTVSRGYENPGVKTSNPIKPFKDYIIRTEPIDEIGIISINGVNVLSIGNILLLTGPMKGRKTMLASILVNQSGRKAAYIDSEQGRKHSWRTGQFTPKADVFHLRGQDQKEIMRVINECVTCGEYELMVLDNVRDLLTDFNNVEQSGELELFLKKISEALPVIAILHENKNSTKGQGHLGHGAAKIAQTTIRVQLVDVEDPSKGSYVECVHSRDEPFKKAFLSMDGILSSDNLLKIGGKAILQDDFFKALGTDEYTRDELTEKISEMFGIMKRSADNALTTIRRACPNAISERKEGKRKIYYVSPGL